MRYISQYRDIHQNETCAILGGGVMLPSDLRSIPQVDILMGINQHTLILPLDYVAFVDRHMFPFVEGYHDIKKITPLNKWGDRDDFIHAGEWPQLGYSGCLAVWAADQMGFKEIICCGMDQYQDYGGREYWWEGPQSPVTNRHHGAKADLTRWIDFLNSLRNPRRVRFASGRIKEAWQ